MNILWAVIQKEFLQVFRSPLLIFILFGSPVVILGLIPFSLGNQARIRINLVDEDHTPSSRRLASSLETSPYFISVRREPSLSRALLRMDRGLTDVTLQIPHHFEKQAGKGDPLPLFIAIDATHTLSAQDHLYYISRTLGSHSPLPEKQIDLQVHKLFNPDSDGKQYFLVSLLVLLITLIGVCFTSISIVNEKEKGILDQLNATPLNRYTYIAGKMIPFALICLSELLIGILFCREVYHFRIAGNLADLILLTLFFLCPMLGLGLLISTLSGNQVQAMYLIIFTLLTLILMSTMFSLLSSMPEWAQALRFFNPLYFMLDASRLIILKGFSLREILPQIGYLALMGISLSGLALYKTHQILTR